MKDTMTNTMISAPETDLNKVMSVSKNKEYLPRLKLCTSQSGECQRGKAGIGHYVLIKSREEILDIGNDIDIIIIAGRSKAFQLGDPPIQSFDPECDLFQDIKEESAKKDSDAMYGPEFLVYIPEHQVFATFFLCNPTGRVFAPDMAARLKESANLTSHLIESKKYKWHGPQIGDCGAPLEVPDQDEINNLATKFLTEKDSVVEVADEGGRER